MKIKPVVKYDFEHRYYHGELVAFHHRRSFVAYALKGGKGGAQGFVKVIRIRAQTADERLLLKGNVIKGSLLYSKVVYCT